jgi:hypothetical protein
VGVWGTGPFDNDTAGDMVAKMLDPIQRVLDLPLSVPFKEVAIKRLKPGKYRKRRVAVAVRRVYSKPIASDYYCEARASAAIIMLAHGTDILGGPRLELVLQALKKMRSDKEWIKVWRTPKEIKKAIDRQIRAVQRKIRVCCRRRRVKTVNRRGRVLRRR